MSYRFSSCINSGHKGGVQKRQAHEIHYVHCDLANLIAEQDGLKLRERREAKKDLQDHCGQLCTFLSLLSQRAAVQGSG